MALESVLPHNCSNLSYFFVPCLNSCGRSRDTHVVKTSHPHMWPAEFRFKVQTFPLTPWDDTNQSCWTVCSFSLNEWATGVATASGHSTSQRSSAKVCVIDEVTIESHFVNSVSAFLTCDNRFCCFLQDYCALLTASASPARKSGCIENWILFYVKQVTEKINLTWSSWFGVFDRKTNGCNTSIEANRLC